MHQTVQIVNSTELTEANIRRLPYNVRNIVEQLLVEGFDLDVIDIQSEMWVRTVGLSEVTALPKIPTVSEPVAPVTIVSVQTVVDQPEHAVEMFRRFLRYRAFAETKMIVDVANDVYLATFRITVEQ